MTFWMFPPEREPETVRCVFDDLVLEEMTLRELLRLAVLEDDVLLDGHRGHDSLGVPFLGDVSHSGDDNLTRGEVLDRSSEQCDCPVLGLPYAVDCLGEFPLTVSGYTCKTDNLSRLDGEIEVVQCKETSVASDAEVLDFQSRFTL